jgi:hypothetical protein
VFENRLITHIDKRNKRSQDLESARLRQIQNIEILKQASLQASLVHTLRRAEQRFISLSKDLTIVINQIEPMVPVIVWVWDNVKNKEKFKNGLDAILTQIRNLASLHHISDLTDLYESAIKDPEGFFKEAVQNLVYLTNNYQNYIEDPVKALRKIHEVQDRLFLTNAFISLLIDSAEDEDLIDNNQINTLKSLINHIDKVENTVNQKEMALFLQM